MSLLQHNEEQRQPFLPGNTDTFNVKFQSTVQEPLAVRFICRCVVQLQSPLI